MASWQAHAIDAALRLFVKRRLPQDIDIPKLRARIEKMAGRPPKGVRISQARVGCLGEWVEVPGVAADAPVMLYLHGGGYVVCSPRTHRPITGFFAHAGFRVFCPDYRMAPEHPFPAAVDDALSPYEGLLSRGVRPGRLSLPAIPPAVDLRWRYSSRCGIAIGRCPPRRRCCRRGPISR